MSHNIYAPKAASNDVYELLDNPEDTEADAVSSVNDPTQPLYFIRIKCMFCERNVN